MIAFDGLSDLITEWYVIGDTVFVNTDPRIMGTLNDTYDSRLALVRAPEGLLAVSVLEDPEGGFADSAFVYAGTGYATPGRAGLVLHRQPD